MPKARRKLAGGASHRIAFPSAFAPAGAMEQIIELNKIPQPLRGLFILCWLSGGSRHRLISIVPPALTAPHSPLPLLTLKKGRKLLGARKRTILSNGQAVRFPQVR